MGHSSPFQKTKHAKVTPGVAWPVSWVLARGCKTAQTSAHASTEPPSSFEVSDQSSYPENSVHPGHARGGSEDWHGYPRTLKRRPNNKHRNPCWSQPRKVGATIPSNISPRETFDTHEPPRKQLASQRNSESTSRYLRSLFTLGNEGARRYTIAARKTRPAAPIEKDSAEQIDKSEETWEAKLDDTGSRGRENTSVRPPYMYIAHIDELRKADVGLEEGRADPQETWIRRRRRRRTSA